MVLSLSVQKIEGQGTQGGVLAKTLDKTSMALFGFSGELTPNEHHAEVLAPLDPQLEKRLFSVYQQFEPGTPDPESMDDPCRWRPGCNPIRW